jgi:hypothetical protein
MYSPEPATHLKEKSIMVTTARPPITEVMRVTTFDTLEFEDRDWEGPKAHGELLTYTSRTASASLRITRGGKAIFDKDYAAKKTIVVDGNVVHLPVGAGPEL